MFKSNKTILWICIFFVFNCVNSQDSNEGYNQDYVDDDGSFEGQGYAGTQDVQNDGTYNEDQYEFSQYATHMANFHPTQTFQFELKVTEQQTLILWPTNQVIAIRGVFYLNSEQKGLFMGVEVHGNIKKSFYNKKLGVFNVPFEGAGDLKLIFKAQIQPVNVYISYELEVKKEQPKLETIQSGQKKEGEAKQKQGEQKKGDDGEQVQYRGENENEQQVEDHFDYNNFDDKNELQKIVKKFEGVKSSLEFHQMILKQIVKHEIVQGQRLEQQINNKTMKLVIQTIFVIGSGVFSLWMLNKEFKKGYELLI